MNRTFKLVKRAGVVLSVPVAAVVTSSSAMAAADVAATVTEISSNTSSITAVGGAILGLAALAIGFKWIKGMIFG